MDSKYPYDSLCECTIADLNELQAVSDYLGLPDTLITKLKCLIRSIETNTYCVAMGNEIHVFTPGDILCADFALVGDLRGLQWAHKRGQEWDTFTCSNAASAGYLDCLQYAHENKCPWNNYAFNCAASNGHLECLQYLYTQGCPYDVAAAYDAAAAGHIECVKWLHMTGICEMNTAVAQSAAFGGYLDIVKYVYASGGELNAKMFTHAARGGHLHVLQWLCKESESIWSSCKNIVYGIALQNDHNHIAYWCYNEQKCSCPVIHEKVRHFKETASQYWKPIEPPRTSIKPIQSAIQPARPDKYAACNTAAKKNDLDELRTAHSSGGVYGKQTMIAAAAAGGLECLKWLHVQGCPWDKTACEAAARGGHLECLKWLHEQGCPWDIMTCKTARKHNRFMCLDYARANGCPDIY